jgi:hypothetical protein
MFRNIALIIVLSLVLVIVPACRPVTAQNGMVTILPEDCRILAGDELSLEIDGSLPSNAVVTWDVDYGTVASVLPGSSAILVAPSTPAVITVYATISGTKPGRWIYATRQCIVSPVDSISG